MNLIKRATLLALALMMALGLTACGPSGPDMPMEVTVAGKNIVIGQTTTGDMADWGWEVEFNGSQDTIDKNAKYVACYYHLKVDGGGAGKEFWASVYVPFYKNFVGTTKVDLSSEEKLSKTMGVVYRVSVRKSASKELNVSYNGTALQDITWDTAKEWGATVNEDDYGNKDAALTAAQGVINFKESARELNELEIIMNTIAFAKLQK